MPGTLRPGWRKRSMLGPEVNCMVIMNLLWFFILDFRPVFRPVFPF